MSMRAIRAPVRFCKPSFGEKGEKKRTEHGFLERKKVKHGFPSILCSSKKDEERDGCSSPLTRPGVSASADELRGRRKLC